MTRRLTFYVVREGSCPWSGPYEAAIEEYCAKWGHNLFFSSTRDQHGPAWHKLKAFEYVSADYLVIMDLDMMPMPWAPNLADHLRYDCLSIVRDRECVRRSPATVQLAELHGYNMDDIVWNTGLVGVPRGKAYFLQWVWDAYAVDRECWYEQALFNELLVKRGEMINELDTRFNATAHLDGPDDLTKYMLDNWFIHAAGADDHIRRYIADAAEALKGTYDEL